MFIPGNKNLGRDHRYAVASILSKDEVGPVFNYESILTKQRLNINHKYLFF